MMRYNNNPANIRFSKRNKWVGLQGCDNGFCKFIDITFGIRALIVILRRYIKVYKCNDVQKIIERFAPPSENNTRAYVRFVCNYLSTRGCSSTDIKYGSPDFCVLCCAIMWFESNFSCDKVRVANLINLFNLK